MNKDQTGTITLPMNFLWTELDLVTEAFSFLNFLPLNVSSDFAKEVVIYSGVATDFPGTPLGQMLPEYMIEINFDKDFQFESARFVCAVINRQRNIKNLNKHGIRFWRIGV